MGLKKILMPVFIILMLALTTYGAVAESWYLKGGSTGLQNYSSSMNQGFYYQNAFNEVNFTSSTNTECGPTATQWKVSGSGSCANPNIANRTDFALFSDTGYLWWHPTNATHGPLIKFQAEAEAEYYYNVSFYKYTGGNNVNFYVKKNGVSGTLLNNYNLSGGQTQHIQGSVNLSVNDNIVFYALTTDSNAGDSSGVILNITTTAETEPPEPEPPLGYNNSNKFMFAHTLNHSNVYDEFEYPDNIEKIHATFFAGTNKSIRTTPTIWNGYAYFGSTNGYLYMNNASNISQNIMSYLISNSNPGNADHISQPAISDGYLYIGTQNSVVHKLNASNITQQISNYTVGGGFIQSSPIIYQDLLYIGTSTGSNKFLQIYTSNMTLRNQLDAGGYAFGSPACDGNYCYFTNGNGNQIVQVDIATFTAYKSYTTGGVISASPMINGDYVYLMSDDSKFYQFNKTDVSKLVNSYQTTCNGFNCETSFHATVWGDYVYFGNGAWDGTFHEYGYLYQANKNNVTQIVNQLLLNGSAYTGFSIDKNGVGLVQVVNGTYTGNLSVNLKGIAYLINASNITNIISRFDYGGGQFDGAHSRPYNDSTGNYAFFGTQDGYLYQLTESDPDYFLLTAKDVFNDASINNFSAVVTGEIETVSWNDVFVSSYYDGGLNRYYNYSLQTPTWRIKFSDIYLNHSSCITSPLMIRWTTSDVSRFENPGITILYCYNNTGSWHNIESSTNFYSGWSVQNYNNLSNTHYTTTTGTITTNIQQNSGFVDVTFYDAQINTGTFNNETYSGWNTANNLEGNLTRFAPAEPEITINANNFFTSTNTSTTNQYFDVLRIINLTFTDDALLYAYQINITNSTSSNMYSVLNTSLTGTTGYAYHTFNSSTWNTGTYTVTVLVADAHTAKEIQKYKVDKRKNEIEFETKNENKIKIKTKDSSSINAQKLLDRYNFEVNFDDKKTSNRIFNIVTDKCKIEYLPHSEYKAHFVTYCNGYGNWIDFEGVGGSYAIRKINDYEYELTISNVPSKAIFNSIGDLNIVENNYSWYKGEYELFTSDTGVLDTGNANANFTRNNDYITNITSAFFFNNNNDTTTTKSDYVTSTYFTNTYTAPSTPGVYDATWEVNITQSDGSTYVFNVSQSTTIYALSVGSCAVNETPTYNITYYNENLPSAKVTASLEYEIDTWTNNPNNRVTHNGNLTLANEHLICITGSNITKYADVYFKYTTPNTFTHKYYAFNETIEVNVTNVVRAYNFNTTAGISQLKLTTRFNNNYNPYPDVLVKLQRRYLDEGVYRTVQYDLSDDYGLVVFDIIERNVDYRIIYTDTDNNILRTGNPAKFVCENDLCDVTQLLSPFAGTATSKRTIIANTTYSNTTKIITTPWYMQDGNNAEVTHKVFLNPATTNRLICNQTVTASAGTFTCNMTGYTGSALVILDVEGNSFSWSQLLGLVRTALKDIMSSGDSVFMTIALMLVIGFSGLVSPLAVIVMTIFSVIIMGFLGVFSGFTLLFITVSVVIGIAIALKVRA